MCAYGRNYGIDIHPSAHCAHSPRHHHLHVGKHFQASQQRPGAISSWWGRVLTLSPSLPHPFHAPPRFPALRTLAVVFVSAFAATVPNRTSAPLVTFNWDHDVQDSLFTYLDSASEPVMDCDGMTVAGASTT